MNVKLDMNEDEDLPEVLTDWRPPGWIVGDPDDPYVPERIEDLYEMYNDAGYYTRGGTLTDKAHDLAEDDRAEVEAVIHNRKLLRDAWNTPGVVWRLAALLIGVGFRVDPFWNQGTQDLPELVVRLDGLTPLTDGMLTVRDARDRLSQYDADTAALVQQRLEQLGDDVPDSFPLNWRQDIEPGEAPGAANGPHSCTKKWLRCVAAYGSQEFAAAFVPDSGDAWFQSIAMTAALVIRLGRAPCIAPPGILASSPRGASALLIWIPPHIRERVETLHALYLTAMSASTRVELCKQLDALLPEPTRRVLLDGKSLAVPLWKRPRSGTQYAIVQRGDLLDGNASVVDLGLT